MPLIASVVPSGDQRTAEGSSSELLGMTARTACPSPLTSQTASGNSPSDGGNCTKTNTYCLAAAGVACPALAVDPTVSVAAIAAIASPLKTTTSLENRARNGCPGVRGLAPSSFGAL